MKTPNVPYTPPQNHTTKLTHTPYTRSVYLLGLWKNAEPKTYREQ